jgi:hypothetical protein
MSSRSPRGIEIPSNFAAQQFVVKPTKCIFGKTKVDYLGHGITIEGVKVDPKKIEAMQT